MDNEVPLDYSYVVYWQVVKYLCMTIITVFFVLPHNNSQTVHPNMLYLFIVCAFTSSLALSYIVQSMCFSQYYYQFVYVWLFSRALSDLILLFLLPYRNYVLDCCILSPRQAIQRNTMLSLPHFGVFLVCFLINLSNAGQQRNYATSDIRKIFSYGQETISVAKMMIFTFNLVQNVQIRKFIKKEFTRTLETTDPLELNFLVERHLQQSDVAAISPTYWSVMRNLTFTRVTAAMVLLFVAAGLNILQEYYKLVFHLVFPIELIAYIILFKPSYGSRVPETLVDLLISESDRKALMIYLQQKQNGLKQFVFLKETAKLRKSTQLKQDIQYIYQKYFNTFSTPQTFSQSTILKIRQKIISLGQLHINSLHTIFQEAEAEALEFLNTQTIPLFYASNIGTRLLTSNSFFESYAISASLLEIEKFAQVRANPLVAFVELIDKFDYSTERFLTHSDKIIQSCHLLLKYFDDLGGSQQVCLLPGTDGQTNAMAQRDGASQPAQPPKAVPKAAQALRAQIGPATQIPQAIEQPQAAREPQADADRPAAEGVQNQARRAPSATPRGRPSPRSPQRARNQAVKQEDGDAAAANTAINTQSALFSDVRLDLERNLQTLESEYMKLTEFVRRQQNTTELYSEFLSSQIGPRPSTRLQLDQKEIYYAEMHRSDGLLSSRDQTSSYSGKRLEQSEISGQLPVKKHRRDIERQFLIDLPKQIKQVCYQRFSSYNSAQHQEYMQDTVATQDFINLDQFDPFVLLRNEKIECPLEAVLKTALDLTGLLQIYDFAPRSIQFFCKMVTKESSGQTYYNIMRSMMALQTLSGYIFTLQGSFDSDQVNLPKVFSKEQVLAALLTAACSHVQHSGMDDHSIISVQHALAIIYNDRDPNQRIAAMNGWSIIMKTSLFNYIDKTEIGIVRTKFIAFMLSFNAKNYSRLISKMKSQKCPPYAQMDQLERQIRKLKPGPELEQAKKAFDAECKGLNQYTDVLLQVILYLSVYSDSCRKRETFELLTQDLTQQLRQQQKIETFTLQKAYLPEINEENDFFTLIHQLYTLDHVVLNGMQFLFQCLREYAKQQEFKIPRDFRDFLARVRGQTMINRAQIIEAINSSETKVKE